MTTTTTTRRTCDCDHGEPQNGKCGAPATKRHYCHNPYAALVFYLCEPCNSECHNRDNERW